MRHVLYQLSVAAAMGFLLLLPAQAQRQMERLGRGVTAVRANSTQVYVGWRLLGNDPSGVAFNLYRSANGGAPVKLNSTPLTTTTDYLDTPVGLSTTAFSYSVRPVIGGTEVADSWAHPLSGAFTLPVNPAVRQYLPVPMQPTPDDTELVSYKVKFCWVGDLDGDGEYDFVVDRYNPTAEARQWLQAYKRDGTLFWQMNMGPNSVNQYSYEPGSSAISIGDTDNVTVYDMDGDGRAEVLVRTANGVTVTNGSGTQVAEITAASNSSQFVSVIDGMSGTELARTSLPNPWAVHGTLTSKAMIAYLDGVRPSVVFYGYNRANTNQFYRVFSAFDFRNGLLSLRWSLPQDHSVMPGAEGHQIRIADVDNDGKDEICEIGHVIDDDGTQLFHIGEIVHGDRFHLTDIDPDRPGLENFIIQQNNGSGLATALFDPGDGTMIKKWYAGSVVDVGRGVVADIDAASKGCEFFSTQPGVFNAKGAQIYSTQPFPPEAIWWDGDLNREFVATVGSTAESPAISRFNPASPANPTRIYTIYNETAPGVYQAYGGRPAFWGDLFGDWREEYLCVANDNSELRIYTTKTASSTRIYSLMHNPQYRCQATTKGYVQSSYVDYYLGNGMTPPPPSPMVDAKLVWRGGAGATTWDAGITSSWNHNGVNSSFAQGDDVRFDISSNSTTPVSLSGTLQPSAVTVYSPTDFTFDGNTGTLAGSMTLVKAGSGTMSLSGSHSFTGKTTIWDGLLHLTGNLQQSPVAVWGGTWGGSPSKGNKGGRIGGTGTFGGAVNLKYRGAITPGAGMGSVGTLSFGGGLAAEDGSVLALDLSDDPTGVIAASDRISVTGDLTLSGKVALVIRPLTQLVPGTFTLVTYTGALSGGIGNLEVSLPAGTPYSLAVGSGSIRITIPVTRAPAALTWSGPGNVWDLAASPNWLRGNTPDVFVAGDSVTFDHTGAADPLVSLTTALPVSSIVVNATTDYTFQGAGSISGSGGLIKSGTGRLTLETTNDYTGPTMINGGVLAVSALGDAGSPGSIGAADAAASNLVINGGTLSLTGSQTNANRNLTLGASGGTLEVSLANSSLQISGSIIGNGQLVKTGPGTLIFAGSNSYSGGTSIDGGTIYLAGAVSNSAGLGSGSVTIRNGTLSMANVQASETAAWNLIVPAGFTGRLNADGRCTLTGSLTGGGDFTFYTPHVRTELNGNWSTFNGRVYAIADADGGDLRFRSSAGLPSAALDLGNKIYAYYNIGLGSDFTFPIGTLSGNAGSVLLGSITAGRTLTWQVGARNENSTFAGIIADHTGPTAITKTGSGTLFLTGACTHSGPTSVIGGRLQVNGSSGSSAFIVQNGGMLGGSGTITGNVTIQNGGGLELGGVGATALAVTGNLGLGTSVIVTPASGALLEPGTFTLLTYTGTLTGSAQFNWAPPSGVNLIASFNTATPGIISVSLSEAPRAPGPIIWTGAVDSNWDTSTGNWIAGSQSTLYQNGDTPTFTDAGNAVSPVNLTAAFEPAGVVVDSAKNHTISGSGSITGSCALLKNGSGMLTMSNAHSYSGGTEIQGGTIVSSNVASLGTGAVTLNGGHWAMGSLAPLNPVVVTADSSVGGGSGGGTHAIRSISGSGVLTIQASGAFDLEGDLSGFSGTFLLSGDGSVRFFSGGNTGSASATFDLGTRSLTARSGNAFFIGALAGSAGSSLGMASNSNSASCTYTIGGNSSSTTFAGFIANGSASKPVGIVKTGSGTLTLTGTNTYTGPTNISAGTLAVQGSLAATPVTVDVGATLSGSGSVGGSVGCAGTLSPGNSIGTLTLASGLVLAPTSILDLQLGSASDRVNVAGALTLDGTVNLSAAPGFDPGTYTVITHTGSLSNNNLNIGSVPQGFTASVDTSTTGQVKLVVVAVNAPPVIAVAASASPADLTPNGSATVSVTASDDSGEGGLTYTWSALGPAPVTFSPNGNNAAKSATATFTAPGTYPLTVTVADGSGLTATSGTEVTVAMRTLAAWQTLNFSEAEILAGDSAPTADPDHDGLANLAEYALGGDPHAFTPPATVSSTQTSLSITFQRPAWISDITYLAEDASELATWEQLTLEVLNPGNDPETVRATRVLPVPRPASRFIRLRFVKPSD